MNPLIWTPLKDPMTMSWVYAVVRTTRAPGICVNNHSGFRVRHENCLPKEAEQRAVPGLGGLKGAFRELGLAHMALGLRARRVERSEDLLERYCHQGHGQPKTSKAGNGRIGK